MFYSDSDVWFALSEMKRQYGKRLQVDWQRSHPERRAMRSAWDRHEHGNDASDKMAGRAMQHFVEAVSPATLCDPEHRGLGIVWSGEEIVGKVRGTLLLARSKGSIWIATFKSGGGSFRMACSRKKTGRLG